MSTARFTAIGGPTVLVECEGWRLLTDPTFDPPGARYSFGWGTSSRKTIGPAITVDELPDIDAVLLSHDHHGDNLDRAGRDLLGGFGTVVTTRAGARRLSRSVPGVIGLRPWETTELVAAGKPTIRLTATPSRHGPPLSRPVAGAVVGFAAQWPGQRAGQLWMTGDTVRYRSVGRVADRLDIGTVLLHLGAVKFGLTGPLRYSMTAAAAVPLLAAIDPATVLPVHYDGWSHFTQGRAAAAAEFAAAPSTVRDRVRWLDAGVTTTVEV